MLAASACALSGCADLMTRSVVAPSWFQARAVEVKGEGYPDIHDVPVARAPANTQAEARADGDKLKVMSAQIDAVTGEVANPSSDDIRASAAQLRAQTDEGPASQSSGKKP